MKALLYWIKRKGSRYRSQLIGLASFFILFLIADQLFPVITAKSYSKVVYAADSSILSAYLSSDDKWRMQTDVREISPALLKALIYKEDRYFYYHPGFNPAAMMRALFNNVIQMKRTSGASTITMQVVRLLEPRKRNYLSKLIEIVRAVQLEIHFSKHQILNLYFNLAPYGGNIEGVKAASVLYFGQQPKHISLAQAVTLVIIPNRPNSLQPGNRNILVQSRNKWIRRLMTDGIFPPQDCMDALNEPIDMKRRPVPVKAPHICQRLNNLYPALNNIYTCIDPETQSKVENITYSHVRMCSNLGITNAAVMVVNNKTSEVIAYVGSADWNDINSSGQVDGCNAVRSPGSTLKPLLYGLALDAGIITPKSVLLDVPYNFKGYIPENYDESYQGIVSAEQALAASLNIPAVQLLEKTGIKNFTGHLVTSGFKQITKDQSKLGLSMILGGCGVTLEELVRLYSSFAKNGKMHSLKYTSAQNEMADQLVISDAASFMITEILAKPNRPDLPVSFANSVNLPRIAWKTGTSYGHRDAWSIGYNSSYTVGVWVGNFDGHGVPELVGAEIAAPLLFKVFNAIDTRQPKKWFAMPADLDIRMVCPHSGLPPEEFCTNHVMDYYIPAISPTSKCSHLKYVFVSPDEKISYCQSCLPEKGYKKKLYPSLAPEMISYYDQNNISYEHIPAHNPLCQKVFDKNSPRIVSLSEDATYFIEKGETQKIALQCVVSGEVEKVYWYLDDKLIGSCLPSEKMFFEPWPGTIKISCQDDKGRNTNIRIKVMYY